MGVTQANGLQCQAASFTICQPLHNHDCNLSTYSAPLPLVLGTAQIGGDVDLGVNISSEMSCFVAGEASSADAVEFAAATNILICITSDCISVLAQFSDTWILTIDCGDGPQKYEDPGEYGGILYGVSPYGRIARARTTRHACFTGQTRLSPKCNTCAVYRA